MRQDLRDSPVPKRLKVLSPDRAPDQLALTLNNLIMPAALLSSDKASTRSLRKRGREVLRAKAQKLGAVLRQCQISGMLYEVLKLLSGLAKGALT